jgi:formylglycine-generating enzyme
MVGIVWHCMLFMLILLPAGLTILPVERAAGAEVPEIKLSFVQGGCFKMGDQFGDGGMDEKPVHEVCVSNFYLGVSMVTEAQWQAVMGQTSPPHPQANGPDFPATRVSWDDAGEFLRRLNKLSGFDYRLPTEAEWEYAARGGGKRRKYAGTDDEQQLGSYACYEASCEDAMQAVGRRRPNELGLYDMSGNAWEWVQDRYDAYYYRQSPRQNPQGDPFGVNRVLLPAR